MNQSKLIEPSHPIFKNTVNMALHRALQQTGAKVICQPVRNEKNEFFKLPVNHEGGQVQCVIEFDSVKNQQEYTCKFCNKKYKQTQLYYDATLELYIREIKNKPLWNNTQSILYFIDGYWEPKKDTLQEYLNQTYSKCLKGIEEFFNETEESIVQNFFQTKILKELQIQIKPKGFTELVKVIKQQIKLNPFVLDSYGKKIINPAMKDCLKNIFFSRVRIQSLNNNLSDVELFFTGLKKWFYAKLALQCDEFTYSPLELHENSRVFMGLDTYVVIGGPKGKDNDLGLKDVYAGRVIDILINFDYGNSQTKYIPLKTVANLKYPRDQFQIAEYDGYLYVIGGYVRKETFDPQCKPNYNQIKQIINDQTYNKKTNPNAILQLVKIIERINLQNIETAQWEDVTKLPDGGFQFGCAIQNNRLIVVGGATIDSTNNNNYLLRRGIKSIQIYDLEKKQWNSFEYLQQDNVLMYVIPLIDDQQNILIFGGQGAYEEARWKNQNNSQVHLYNTEKKNYLTKPNLQNQLDIFNINNWDIVELKLQAEILGEINKQNQRKYTAAVIKQISLQGKNEQGKPFTQFVFYDSERQQFEKSNLF